MCSNIFQFLLLLMVAGVSEAQNQCGRMDWSAVQYEYYPGHRGESPRAASIQSVAENEGRLTIVARKSGVPQANYYSVPEYFETRDEGKVWQALPGDIPSGVPAAPYIYFQAPSDPTVIYKLISDLGLYLRSVDGGHRWRLPKYEIDGKSPDQVAEQLGGATGFHLEVLIVAVHPTDPNTLYAGMRATPWPGSGDDLTDHSLLGLFRSTDGGDHWAKFTDEIQAFRPNWTGTSVLGINPTNPDVVFGVGRHGIEKSTDAGRTWLPVGEEHSLEARPLYRAELKSKTKILGAPVALEAYEFLFDPKDTQTVYLLSNRGIFKTVDQGKSWRLLDLGFDEVDAITTVALNPGQSNQLFVGSRYGLFASHDGGCHFRRFPSPGENSTGPKVALTP